MRLVFNCLLMVGLLGACAQDKKKEDDIHSVVPEQQGMDKIELVADVMSSFNLEKNEERDESTLKALTVYQKNANPKSPFTFDIDINRYRDVKVRLFLKQKGTTAVKSLLSEAKISKLPNGRYSMKMVIDNVSAPAGSSFLNGEWYVAGIWGGGDQSRVTDPLTHRINDVSPIAPNTIGEKNDMNIPLAFPWTKLQVERIGSRVLLKNKQLVIRPLGIILSVLPENRTRYTLDLVSVDRQMVGFSLGGEMSARYVSDADLTRGAYPTIIGTSIDDIESQEDPSLFILPRKIQLDKAEKSNSPVYLWLLPTEESRHNYELSFSFISSKRRTNGENIPYYDRFSQNGVGPFDDRYNVDLSFRDKPKHGEYFIKEIPLRASLMITEYFINRVHNGYDGDTNVFNHPYFYGYVEIYNPNIDKVALKDYALARISNVRLATDYGSGYTYGPNFPYFHPGGGEKFAESGNTGSHGTADRNADIYTESHKALLLSLQLKDGAHSSFSPNSLGFKSRFETRSGRVEVDLSYREHDSRIEKVRFIKPTSQPSGDAMLDGGKTMLIFGNGFLGKNSHNTPDYIHDTRVYSLPRDLYSHIYWSDVCQYIVAVDNYRRIDGYAIYEDSGVMNLNLSDALFLVQKHKNDQRRRRVVDATSTHPFSRKNNWSEYVYWITRATNSRLAPNHFRVRTVAQHLPEFLNYDNSQWYHYSYDNGSTNERYGASIPPPVSPGTRYYGEYNVR